MQELVKTPVIDRGAKWRNKTVNQRGDQDTNTRTTRSACRETSILVGRTESGKKASEGDEMVWRDYVIKNRRRTKERRPAKCEKEYEKTSKGKDKERRPENA